MSPAAKTRRNPRAVVTRPKSADVGRGTRRAVVVGPGRRPADPVGVRAGARVARHRPAQVALRAVHRRQGGRAASSGQWFTTVDPATEEPLAEIARANVEDVDYAVGVARRAFKREWGELPGRERAKYLFRIARILQERSREFAVLESLDGGKPIKRVARRRRAARRGALLVLRRLGGQARVRVPRTASPRPLGVAAQVIPWNFPLLMLAWKIAPALAAGNTVVLKPASSTPLSALFFADVCRQAELPPGVVNIITGPGEIGLALVKHPDVDKVAFTGSTAVGKEIGRAIAGTDKALTLELGGKAANIIFDDAPIDQAIEGVVNGIFFNQGEVCCAGSRLLVQESIAEPVHRAAEGPPVDAARGRPARQEHRRRRDQQRGPAGQDRGDDRGRQGRGRRDVPARLRAAGARLVRPADAVHQRQPVEPRSRRRRSSGRCCR